MATTASVAAACHLRILRNPVDDSQDGVDIVLVPGIGTKSPENWPLAKQEWLTTLPGSGNGARVLTFQYASPFAGAVPSWESLLMTSYDFLQKLGDMRSQSGPDPTAKPILIICHSLGGIVVKQALCVANKQFNRYGSIVNAIAGVIFLSTPHRYDDKTMCFIRFRDILEATTGKNLRVPNESIEQEGAILLDLADRFDAISFRTPILSVYELRESKNSSTPLRPKYQVLVDREACSTNAPMETVIGLNLNHHDTCIFTKSVGGEGLPKFNKFIYETLNDAGRVVALRLEDQEYQYATMSAYSPTMSELPLKVDELELTEWPSTGATDWPSNRATEGTSLSGAKINEALEIWSVDPSAHKNEIARTTFLKGKLFEATGKTQKASIAFRVACRLRKEITKDNRDMKNLSMGDFDELVAFWAR